MLRVCEAMLKQWRDTSLTDPQSLRWLGPHKPRLRCGSGSCSSETKGTLAKHTRKTRKHLTLGDECTGKLSHKVVSRPEKSANQKAKSIRLARPNFRNEQTPPKSSGNVEAIML